MLTFFNWLLRSVGTKTNPNRIENKIRSTEAKASFLISTVLSRVKSAMTGVEFKSFSHRDRLNDESNVTEAAVDASGFK